MHYTYEDARVLIEELKKNKPKIKVTIVEYIKGCWQLKSNQRAPKDAWEDSYFYDPDYPHGDGCMGEEIQFNKRKKVYGNSYYQCAEGVFDSDWLVEILDDYIKNTNEEDLSQRSEWEEKPYTWEDFHQRFWNDSEHNMSVPEAISNYCDHGFNMTLGYPQWEDNIGWNSYVQAGDLDEQSIEIL